MLDSWLGWLALSALIVVMIFGLLGRLRPRSNWHGGSALSYGTVLIVAAVSPFVTAFAAKLGERLGEKVRIERMSRRERRRRSAELVVVSPFRRVITIDVGAGLSDEARLALIDLDFEQPELWGHLLRWDEEVAAWLPVPGAPESEGTD